MGNELPPVLDKLSVLLESSPQVEHEIPSSLRSLLWQFSSHIVLSPIASVFPSLLDPSHYIQTCFILSQKYITAHFTFYLSHNFFCSLCSKIPCKCLYLLTVMLFFLKFTSNRVFPCYSNKAALISIANDPHVAKSNSFSLTCLTCNIWHSRSLSPPWHDIMRSSSLSWPHKFWVSR